jgi:putative transposase
MSDHPDAEQTGDAIKMVATVRGGKNAIDGVVVRTGRGTTHTASDPTALCG